MDRERKYSQERNTKNSVKDTYNRMNKNYREDKNIKMPSFIPNHENVVIRKRQFQIKCDNITYDKDIFNQIYLLFEDIEGNLQKFKDLVEEAEYLKGVIHDLIKETNVKIYNPDISTCAESNIYYSKRYKSLMIISKIIVKVGVQLYSVIPMCYSKKCMILDYPEFVSIANMKNNKSVIVFKEYEKNNQGTYFLHNPSGLPDCIFDDKMSKEGCKYIDIDYPPPSIRSMDGYKYTCFKDICYVMLWNSKVARQLVEPEILKEIFKEKERLYNETETSGDSWISWDWEFSKIFETFLEEYIQYLYVGGAVLLLLCVMVTAHLILSYILLRKTQANEKKARKRSLENDETQREALLLALERRQNDHID